MLKMQSNRQASERKKHMILQLKKKRFADGENFDVDFFNNLE